MTRWIALLAGVACAGGSTEATDADETETDTPVDRDQDGVSEERDCDDTDPDISPEAPERCNGVDDDCDGEIDEDAIDAATFYGDEDGDGVGGLRFEVEACEAPEGFSPTPGDCDDEEARIYPGAEEVCFDGIDNDCEPGVSGCELSGTIAVADGLPQLRRAWESDGVFRCHFVDLVADPHLDVLCPWVDATLRAGPVTADNEVIIPVNTSFASDGVIGWGDLDADGLPDLAYLPGLVAWGPQTPFAAPTDLELPAGAHLSLAGDLDGDGQHDLLVRTGEGPTWIRGPIERQPATLEPVLADASNDVDRLVPDVIGGPGHDLVVRLGDTWYVAAFFDLGRRERWVEVSAQMSVVDDLTGDGRADLVLPSAEGAVLVRGPVEPGVEPEVVLTLAGLTERHAAVLDGNGDGELDLVATDTEGRFHVFLGPFDGSVQAGEAAVRFGGPGGPADGPASVDDLDGDGTPDWLLPVDGALSSEGRVHALVYFGDGR